MHHTVNGERHHCEKASVVLKQAWFSPLNKQPESLQPDAHRLSRHRELLGERTTELLDRTLFDFWLRSSAGGSTGDFADLYRLIGSSPIFPCEPQLLPRHHEASCKVIRLPLFTGLEA